MRLMIALAAALALESCGNAFFSPGPGEEMFFIENRGATMPVWVKGRADSGDVMIWLHGGPGNSTAKFWDLPAFASLQEELRVVYWDQRSSWFSMGHYDDALVTAEQAAQDLDVLVDLVRLRYAPERLILAGISWGGFLGTVYLGDPARQAKVDAWIEVDGAHDMPYGVELSIAFVKAYAASHTVPGDPERARWEDALGWYEAHPDPASWSGGLTGDFQRHCSMVSDAHGYEPEGSVTAMPFELAVTSPFHSVSIDRWGRAFPFWTIDVSENLGRIQIPAAVFWGRLDGILPLPLAYQAYDLLGTAAEDKALLLFEESGHTVPWTEPEHFSEAVLSVAAALREGRPFASIRERRR